MNKKKLKQQLLERDYRDICYFIDHVSDVKLRIDIIKSLGYKIGVNIIKNDRDDKVKLMTKGKRNEYRIQIAPKDKHTPLAACAIVE